MTLQLVLFALFIYSGILVFLFQIVHLQGGSGGSGNQPDVVELTDSNFESTVINSDDLWLVEFYAPWCGHCQRLAPEWKKAAAELRGKVKLGALDADTHKQMGSLYGVSSTRSLMK
jgi:protein disulfide-isomerase A6